MNNDITTAKSNGLHPAIHDHYSDMNAALHERDKLQVEVETLRSEKASHIAIIEHLKSQVATITSQRDHYMRYSYALTTRINAMQDIWNGMMELAKDEADNPGPIPQPQSIPKAANISSNCDQEEDA